LAFIAATPSSAAVLPVAPGLALAAAFALGLAAALAAGLAAGADLSTGFAGRAACLVAGFMVSDRRDPHDPG